jgi:glycerol uptake facilitator-like aquaporin
VLLWLFSRISGAFFNPAVTVAFMLRRRISVKRGAAYCGCQVGRRGDDAFTTAHVPRTASVAPLKIIPTLAPLVQRTASVTLLKIRIACCGRQFIGAFLAGIILKMTVRRRPCSE